MPWRKEKQDGSIEEDVPVLTRRMVSSAQDYYELSTGIIALQPGLDSHSRLLVLFHEWAHRLLHPTGTEEQRAQREWQAEATSYVVAQHFGVDHPFAADYLASWRATPEQLEAQLSAVLRASSHIIQAHTAEAHQPVREGDEPVSSGLALVAHESPVEQAPRLAHELVIRVTAEMLDGTLITEEVVGLDAFIEMVLSFRRDAEVIRLTWKLGRTAEQSSLQAA
jgi:hypothetical protein